MSDKYILNAEGEPQPEPDLLKWAKWFEDSPNRQVACDTIGRSKISTVFLGLNHALDPHVQPILWETMVFGGKLCGATDRCSGTRKDALQMHKIMVERVRE